MVGCDDHGQAEGTSAPARSMRIDMASDGDAPSIARSAVKGFCEDLDEERGATLALLVSEIVSNAVIHSDAPTGASIMMSIRIDSGSVRVDVADSGSYFAGMGRRAGAPARDDAGGSDLAMAAGGGFGLAIVDRASSHWGIERGVGTNVWFDLDR